jgi:AmmeMemoRadiSam system protein A
MSEDLDVRRQRTLLELARSAIRRQLGAEKTRTAALVDPVLDQRRGAFVTLEVDGQLRGCIGYPLPYKPLAQTIQEVAVSAASQDYRFEPLRLEELDRLKIEISVLSLPRPVHSPEEVEVGRHGIIISKGPRKGLLLPQVPGEYGWDRETYLRHGCLKAGLGENEWKKGVKIEVFTAQVFSE